MILIVTTKSDISAFHVADWINAVGCEIIFVTDDSTVKVIKYNLNSDFFEIEIDGRIINSTEINAVWYRKIEFKISKPNIDIKDDIYLQNILEVFIGLESKVIDEMLSSVLLNKCVTINNNENLYVNKLLQLTNAKKIGLNIPETNIITKKSDLAILLQDEKLITKGIYESFKCETNNKSFSSATELVSEKKTAYPNVFFPSLVQKYIDKQFEVRSFYLDEKFYSMAIFSQNNKQTAIDFRHYDLKKPNRMIPFNLPENIARKLIKLMKSLKLDCGSIDLIVTPEDDFYFLEVNPVGQFGFVSGCCNYNIEKKIANYLTTNGKSN